MEEKKIATAIDVLINVDRFEHIQVTKYSEKKITYESNEEMIRKEDELTAELVSDIVRTMRALPNQLGKKTEAVAKIENKIQKRIPEWLENGADPNIANGARRQHEKSVAEANAKSEDKREKAKEVEVETDALFADKSQDDVVTKVEENPVENVGEDIGEDEDLFGEDLFNEKK